MIESLGAFFLPHPGRTFPLIKPLNRQWGGRIKTELASENIDKGKSILGAPPKLEKKDVKNPRAKKNNSQKPKQKKQHLYHHCGVTGHTRPNCYKWLAT